MSSSPGSYATRACVSAEAGDRILGNAIIQSEVDGFALIVANYEPPDCITWPVNCAKDLDASQPFVRPLPRRGGRGARGSIRNPIDEG